MIRTGILSSLNLRLSICDCQFAICNSAPQFPLFTTYRAPPSSPEIAPKLARPVEAEPIASKLPNCENEMARIM
jgi:hypothetical protein